jgi:hypothetical protein
MFHNFHPLMLLTEFFTTLAQGLFGALADFLVGSFDSTLN